MKKKREKQTVDSGGKEYAKAQTIASQRVLRTGMVWDGLENEFRETCNRLAGPEQTIRIAAVNLDQYGYALREGLAHAIKRAVELDLSAVYFEYDLDNLWAGDFYLCKYYYPESANDDEWACDWMESLDGPQQEELSDIYLENHFDKTPTAKGSTLYLVARTVALYGRGYSEIETPATLAICIAFHDQDPILRIQHPLDEV